MEIGLKYLTLDALDVTGIEENAFNANQFVNLHILKFRRMTILPVSDGIFNGLHNLKVLHIEDAYLGGFSKLALKQVPNLEALAIYDCRYSLWFDSLFESVKMMHLHQVFIENCTIKDSITEKTFAGLSKIMELYLTQNHIKKIEVGSFDMILKTLNILDLGWNNLTTLPENLFGTRPPNLVRIDLTGNPWNCNNSLLNAINAPENVEFSEVLCVTPIEYRGCSLNSLIPQRNETMIEGQTQNRSVDQRYWFTPYTCEPIEESLEDEEVEEEGIELSEDEKENPMDIAVEFKMYQLEEEDEKEDGEKSKKEGEKEIKTKTAGEKEIEAKSAGKKQIEFEITDKELDKVIETAANFESTVVEGNLEAKPEIKHEKMPEFTDNEDKNPGKITQSANNENKHDDEETGKIEKSVEEDQKRAEITSTLPEPIGTVLPTVSSITTEYINSQTDTNSHSVNNSAVKLSSCFIFLFFSFMRVFY